MSRNEAAVSYDDVTRKRKDDWSSQQVAFRHFNNYVKKTLIQFSLDQVAAAQAAGPDGVAVLDIASGRGGDIGKWAFMQSPPQGNARFPESVLRTAAYDCYDVSPECIAEAERRFTELASTSAKPLECRATFTVADCFSAAFLTQTLPSSPLFGRYHVVTIQFAFHYACQSVQLIQDVLAAVSGALAPGGVVLITTVDIHVLSERAARQQLCNELYSITFPDPPLWDGAEDGQPPLLAPCTKYHFKLEGFVDCAEYVVPRDAVVRVANEVGLHECSSMSKPFSDFVHDYAASWKINKGNKLSQAELELVTLYCSLCFQKKR